MFVDNDLKVEGTNKEPGLNEIDQFMEDLENSKRHYMPKYPIESSLPSFEVERSQIRATYTIENHSEDYNNAMKCINGLVETMSTIASSIQPLVVAWKKKEFNIDLNEVS